MSFATKVTTSKRFILSTCNAGLLMAAIVIPMSSANAHETAKTDNKAMSASAMEHPAMSGMKDMSDMKDMSMTGDVDYDFAANMRMHHQMAVEMSQAQLKNGKSPKLRAMATNIIAAQKKEIATLDAWMAAHKKETPKVKP